MVVQPAPTERSTWPVMPSRRSIGYKNHDLPPTVRSKRESPSVTMSSPAVSCSFTMHETASRYCSRKRESPRASLKARPWSTSVNHDGRGQEPVTVVGSVSSRVALSMPGFLRRVGYTKSGLYDAAHGDRLDPL